MPAPTYAGHLSLDGPGPAHAELRAPPRGVFYEHLRSMRGMLGGLAHAAPHEPSGDARYFERGTAGVPHASLVNRTPTPLLAHVADGQSSQGTSRRGGFDDRFHEQRGHVAPHEASRSSGAASDGARHSPVSSGSSQAGQDLVLGRFLPLFEAFDEIIGVLAVGAEPRGGEAEVDVGAAPDWAIEALPTHTGTLEEMQALPVEHQTCSICLEDFQAGEVQRTLPCFHRFHQPCIDAWLHRCGSCPICKHQCTGHGPNATEGRV